MNKFKIALLIGMTATSVTAQTSKETTDADLQQQVVQLRALVEDLQARVNELEKRPHLPEVKDAALPQTVAEPVHAAAVEAGDHLPPPTALNDPLHGTTVNLLFDGYYGYNFNSPIGRVNLLRAYDVSSNAFSLNQADLVVENAADPSNGKRYGARLDLQYGQATATLQGNGDNEPRPGIYRNIFQAYGTYVFPVGQGLTVDFGKFASSLGLEGNYTKDQVNYSRSLWFNFLPFYHMGIRASMKLNDKLSLNYWTVNGTQQTEPFNGFKDQFAGAVIQPNKNFTWTVNYYFGQEHPDVVFYPNGGAPPGLPTEQGVPFLPLFHQPTGKLHIFDTYVTWQAKPKLFLAAEADYVVERQFTKSPPMHAQGGTLYAQYQLTPKLSIAGRGEYVADDGLLTGLGQALKESTITGKYQVADGFLLLGEWRRDFGNLPYFYTNQLGVLKKEQTTATLGVVWWFGAKQGAW